MHITSPTQGFTTQQSCSRNATTLHGVSGIGGVFTKNGMAIISPEQPLKCPSLNLISFFFFTPIKFHYFFHRIPLSPLHLFRLHWTSWKKDSLIFYHFSVNNFRLKNNRIYNFYLVLHIHFISFRSISSICPSVHNHIHPSHPHTVRPPWVCCGVPFSTPWRCWDRRSSTRPSSTPSHSSWRGVHEQTSHYICSLLICPCPCFFYL